MSLRIGAAHAPLIALLLAATVLVLAPLVASADFSVPPVADGLIVGSAIVRRMATAAERPRGDVLSEVGAYVEELLGALSSAK